MRGEEPRRARQHGQSTTEYAVAIGGLVLVVGIASVLGLKIRDSFVSTSSGVQQASEASENDSPAATLFSDDFSDDTGDWAFTAKKKWRIADGHLVASRRGERRAWATGSGGTDYVISTKAIMTKGKGYGIWFRADGAKKPNGYTFQYDPGYRGGEFLLRKWVNGRQKRPFARAKPPDGFVWKGVEHEIEVSAEGTTFTVTIDGRVVLTGVDDTYASGIAGLRVWSKTDPSFDYFTVTRPAVEGNAAA